MSTLTLKLAVTTAAVLAAASLTATTAPALDGATRGRVVTALADRLDEQYVSPELAGKMSALLRQKLRAGDYERVSDPEAFARTLTNDLQSVSHDGHLRVSWSAEPRPKAAEASAPPPEELARARERFRHENAGFEKVERLPGNIGYVGLRYFAFADMVGDRIASVFALLADTDALIVDLRDNGGAVDPSSIALFCGYLLPERTLVNELHWREKGRVRVEQSWTPGWVPGRRYLDKPVYLLTSRRTFSGAEEFAYDLQALGRATIVGETTGGGANPGGDVWLDEHFSAFMPTGRAVNPITKTNWEGTGVVPEIATSRTRALIVARQEALKRVMTAAAPDDRRRQEWNEALRQAEQDAARVRAVSFRLSGHDGARQAGIAGEWNGWNPRSAPMERKDGAWQASVDLEPGRYPYKFVVDGEWFVDPANPETLQDGPHTNSVVTVAAAGCPGGETVAASGAPPKAP